eukprot:5272340-Alexandrium_andersonii.AAC.1
MAHVSIFLELPLLSGIELSFERLAARDRCSRSAFAACCRCGSAAIALASADVIDRPSGTN